MKSIATAIAVVLSFASLKAAKPEPTVRPNCYPAEIKVLTTVSVQTGDDYDFEALYEVVGTGEVYAMYCEDFLPGDHFVGLMCDNDTPDNPKDDFYVKVISWYKN